MAQRVGNSLAFRHGENVGAIKLQRGKVIPVQGTEHPRRALETVVNNTRIYQQAESRKTVKAIPSKNAIVHKDVSGKSDNEENWSCTLVVKSSKLETIQDEYKEGVKAKDVVDIDANDHENPFACAEYAEQICVYLKKRETEYQVPANYMEFQQEINERMRAILVDWLVEVHDKFKLTQETLYLAISILDRYLATSNKAKKTDLQLIGVTAMLLASKIEEIYAPEIKDFAYITDYTYSSSMIRSLETKMARHLQYNFGDPLCIQFLRRNAKAVKIDAEKHILAKYFMELMLPDYASICFPPSQRAAASLCLAMKITDNSPWNATVAYYSKYTEASLVPCMKRIAQLVLKSRSKQSSLVSVTRKYSRSKYCKIASSPCLSSAYIVELPDDK